MTETAGISIQEQGSGEFQSLGSIVASTIKVIGEHDQRGAADVPGPTKAKGTERQTRRCRRRKKKGGWRELSGMTIDDARAALDVYHAARRARCELNRLISINLDPVEGETVQARRARHARKVDHMLEGLRRRGQENIALISWQWPQGGRLHPHMLLRVEPQNDDLVSGWHDPPAVHVRPAYDAGAVRYIVRERLPGSREWETRNGLPRVTGTRFRGKRLTITPAAQDLLNFAKLKPKRLPRMEPEPVLITWQCDQTGQFSLFDAAAEPVSLDAFRRGRLSSGAAAELEDRRRRLGLSQRELGRLAGLSQPTISNAIAGRDGLSRYAAMRLRAVLEIAA